jgi:hypothetical protein
MAGQLVGKSKYLGKIYMDWRTYTVLKISTSVLVESHC